MLLRSFFSIRHVAWLSRYFRDHGDRLRPSRAEEPGQAALPGDDILVPCEPRQELDLLGPILGHEPEHADDATALHCARALEALQKNFAVGAPSKRTDAIAVRSEAQLVDRIQRSRRVLALLQLRPTEFDRDLSRKHERLAPQRFDQRISGPNEGRPVEPVRSRDSPREHGAGPDSVLDLRARIAMARSRSSVSPVDLGIDLAPRDPIDHRGEDRGRELGIERRLENGDQLVSIEVSLADVVEDASRRGELPPRGRSRERARAGSRTEVSFRARPRA